MRYQILTKQVILQFIIVSVLVTAGYAQEMGTFDKVYTSNSAGGKVGSNEETFTSKYPGSYYGFEFLLYPVRVKPSGVFYQEFDPGYGAGLNVRFYYNTGPYGGLIGGLSYQKSVMKYESGTMKAGILALEFGAALNLDRKGSGIYVLCGFAKISHSGGPYIDKEDMWSSDDNWDRYETGSQSGYRLKGGFIIMITENIGLDCSYAWDCVMMEHETMIGEKEERMVGDMKTIGIGAVYRLPL